MKEKRKASPEFTPWCTTDANGYRGHTAASSLSLQSFFQAFNHVTETLSTNNDPTGPLIFSVPTLATILRSPMR